MKKTYKLVGVFLTIAAFTLGMQAPASSGAGKQASRPFISNPHDGQSMEDW